MLYRDPGEAARWITEILGFTEAIRYTVPDGGAAGHIELTRDGAVLMLGLAGGRFGENAAITLVGEFPGEPASALRAGAGPRRTGQVAHDPLPSGPRPSAANLGPVTAG